MTVAGLFLIAGGVATLISFRSVLFGTTSPSEDETRQRPSEDETRQRPREDGAERDEEAAPERPAPVGGGTRSNQIVLSWPPLNAAPPPGLASWSARNMNGRPRSLTVFPGRPGERPTVLENRSFPTPYVSRHAADPPC